MDAIQRKLKEERAKERIEYLKELRGRDYNVFLRELQIDKLIASVSGTLDDCEILGRFEDDITKLKEKQ